MPDLIETVDCDEPAQMLEELTARRYFSRGYRTAASGMERWIFRGQGNAAWALLPTALRTAPGPRLYTENGWREEAPATHSSQVDAEYRTVQRFFWAADAQGISLPGDTPVVRDSLAKLAHFTSGREVAPGLAEAIWPPDELMGVIALGQHHGLPTRLLDWTRRPLLGAYFAAADAIKLLAEHRLNAEDDRLVVFAFQTSILELDPWDKWSTGDEPDIRLVAPARAGNANLHAQGGVFTFQRWPVHLRDQRVRREPIDESLRRIRHPLDQTILRRLTLPVSRASSLLGLLYGEDVTAATAFPGPGGIVRHLLEEGHLER